MLAPSRKVDECKPLALGPLLDTGPAPLVPYIAERLTEAKFDKVKPARDAVCEAGA